MAESVSDRGMVDKRRIAVLSSGHFINDLYGNTLSSLIPFLIPALGLSLPMVGLLVAIYQITSSVIQPVLGHMADRFGTRVFSFAGTAAAAIGAAGMGVAPSYAILIILVAVAGLGTASFHPQSAAMVNALCRGRRGAIMSTYLTAGSAGFALGPVMVVPVVTAFGLRATPLLAVPGLISALLLGLYAPRNWLQRPDKKRAPVWRVIGTRWSDLARLLGASSLRSLTYMGLVTFLPILLQSRGYPPSVWAGLMTVFLISGTLGGLFGGYLSDRIGRRLVIVGSMLLAVPLLLLMLRSDGIALWILTVPAGMALLASFSVLTVRVQEMLPQNVGMASGLVLGFTIGVGGMAMGPVGMLAERLGVETTLSVMAFLPLVGATLVLTLGDQPKARLDKAGAVSASGSR